ncbi:hypothetical protein [Neobacillus sp. NPDC093127]|uniref:hypothetical protein n=1 Tax=Neobacillus sp. NPDC093127 TaxID=3364296 RepID=UPI003825FAD7
MATAEKKLNDEILIYQSMVRKRNREQKEVDENINELLGASRNLYWSIMEAQEKSESSKIISEYEGVFEKAYEYMELSSKSLNTEKINYSSSRQNSEHIINQPNRKVDNRMRNFFGGLPVIEFQEIKSAWDNFIEMHTAKALILLIGSILNLFFGEFNILLYAFLFFSIAHFIMRIVANKYKNQDEYIGNLKNLQLFLFSYLLLAIGKVLSGFMSFNGLPEGTFYALYLLLGIYAELKGLVKNAKIAQFPIHPMLDKIINPTNNNNNKIDPPF